MGHESVRWLQKKKKEVTKTLNPSYKPINYELRKIDQRKGFGSSKVKMIIK